MWYEGAEQTGQIMNSVGEPLISIFPQIGTLPMTSELAFIFVVFAKYYSSMGCVKQEP
jgi:hypothetical protein